ncbi:hypothetical protein E2C01_059771 [Portunus trituberculatus]|uniref:Uncharacterized protein n=1 Tax=Portunus trituberculatus TaxID=210409 RepID=A0A5B7H6A4_PORTR|nr:hypothetical protein [Portunus trituberculatus]
MCVSRGYTKYKCQQRLHIIHVSAEVTHHTYVSRGYTPYVCQQRLHTICVSVEVTHHMCVSRGYTPYMYQQSGSVAQYRSLGGCAGSTEDALVTWSLLYIIMYKPVVEYDR